MVRIPHNPDFESWRRAARRALVRRLAPADVVFDDGSAGLLPGLTDLAADDPVDAVVASVPRRLIDLARVAADHSDPARWGLLYELFFHTIYCDPRLIDDLSDPRVRRATLMAQSVRRDVHKMHAFVRFRKVEADDASDRYVAFHRPDHYIVGRAAPFFRERFGGMRWAILTPKGSVHWDGRALGFGGPVDTSPVEADSLEDLWRTYYRSTFNPARVKVRAMKAEMPVRHWKTLPETQDIPDLLNEARPRVGTMMTRKPALKTTSAADFLPDLTSIAPPDRLTVLRDAAAGCRGCDLCCNGSTQTVFGEGPATATCVFVGEQPGDTEDRAGRPFVGPAGNLMDELLDQAGLDRSSVYVTNTVKHFHFVQTGARRLHQKPLARHVSACKPWLRAELDVIRPQLVVALGSTAAQALMGRDFRVTRQRGELLDAPPPASPGSRFLATIHPSAILRIPDDESRHRARAAFVEDMKRVGREVGQK